MRIHTIWKTEEEKEEEQKTTKRRKRWSMNHSAICIYFFNKTFWLQTKQNYVYKIKNWKLHFWLCKQYCHCSQSFNGSINQKDIQASLDNRTTGSDFKRNDRCKPTSLTDKCDLTERKIDSDAFLCGTRSGPSPPHWEHK